MLRHGVESCSAWVARIRDSLTRGLARVTARVQARKGVSLEPQAAPALLHAQPLSGSPLESGVRSAFLRHITHHVRTPVTTILGYADRLDETGLSSADRAQAVQSIRKSAEHLLELVDDLIVMAMLETGQMTARPRDVQLRPALSACFERARYLGASSGLSMRVSVDESVPEWVRVDIDIVSRIVTNLLERSVLHTRAGAVTLSAGFEQTPPKLVIEVRDTGSGPSVRGPSQAAWGTDLGGRGLINDEPAGKQINDLLATLVHGTLTVTRSEDAGAPQTLARLCVPVEPVSLKTPRSEPMPVHLAPIGLTGRVLVAEDSVEIQRLVAFMLKGMGVTCEIVGDGRSAVDRALAATLTGAPFDAVLLDMQMPVLDGYGATTKLRAAGFHGPIIALTAYAGPEDREKCLCAGCDEYLTKPVDRFELSRCLSRYLISRPSQAQARADAPGSRAAA